MNDLVKRLRGSYSMGPFGDRDFSDFIAPIQIEAADEIEKLRQLIKTYKNIPFPCHDYMLKEEWEEICKICGEDDVRTQL